MIGPMLAKYCFRGGSMSVKTKTNIFYAQSGGVTSVINASACGVLETARAHGDKIGKVLAGKNGIIGALKEELFDTSRENTAAIKALRSTPGGAFGSCRYKLKSAKENEREYQRLVEVFTAHNIGIFLYNGGGDSQDTAQKVAEFSRKVGSPVKCIGIPKTVDNDLPATDCSPGFGSVAKYVAISAQEASLDVASMSATSTKVFILEVMGRHAGWIAASSCLGQSAKGDPPHIILLPEIPFDEEKFLSRVSKTVEKEGYCVIVASEGTRYLDGRFVADTGLEDAFGHKQLGGVAPILADLVKTRLGYKYHWAVADYLQRSARHIASGTDVEQAYAVGKEAVLLALSGETSVMPTIVRTSDEPYRWRIDKVKLSKVANKERKVPRSYINRDGFNINAKGKRYLAPLIFGEAYPSYKDGLPKYTRLKNILVAAKLPPFEI